MHFVFPSRTSAVSFSPSKGAYLAVPLWCKRPRKTCGTLAPIAALILRGKIRQIEESIDEKQLLKNKAIIQSMTEKERENPDIINGSRRIRIAKGAGVQVTDVNQLIKQFNQSKEMMKQLKNGKFKNMF